MECVAIVELIVDPCHVLLQHLFANRAAEGTRQEVADQTLGILLRMGGGRDERIGGPIGLGSLHGNLGWRLALGFRRGRPNAA